MKIQRKAKLRKVPGFSLIEILLVVGIIAFLAVMVSTRVIEDTENAKVGLAKSGVRLVTTKAQAYFMDTGFVPNKLADLITQSAQVDNWRGAILDPDSGARSLECSLRSQSAG